MDLYLAEAAQPFGIAVSTAVNTFTTKQNVTSVPALPIVPARKWRPGLKVKLAARGNFSTTGTPTLQLGFWFGIQAGTITGDIALSSAITTGSGAAAWPWILEWDGICTAIGTAGSIIGQGRLYLGTSLTAFAQPVPIPITAGARTVAIDTTIDRAIGVSAAFSASSASNQVQVDSNEVVYLN